MSDPPRSLCPRVGCVVRQLRSLQGPVREMLPPSLTSASWAPQIDWYFLSLGHLASCISGWGRWLCSRVLEVWLPLSGTPTPPSGGHFRQTNGHVGLPLTAWFPAVPEGRGE